MSHSSTTAASIAFSSKLRLDIIDVAREATLACNGQFEDFEDLLYCSLHTTAGFLQQSLAAKLGHQRDSVESFVRSAQRLFPKGAPYWHDRMELRTELSEEQRKHEPLNADAHLAFISLGLANCVTYRSKPTTPVYLIDLDGIHEGVTRKRTSLVIGYNRAECVHKKTIEFLAPNNHVAAVNLGTTCIGLAEQVPALIAKHAIQRGLVTLELDDDEQHAGLTVNEFETLLVEKDITGVLLDPLKYMVRKAPQLVRDPFSLPGKARRFLTYELKQVVREVLSTASRNVSALERMVERLDWHLPILEHIIDRLAAPSEARWMNLGRSINLLVNANDGEKSGSVVLGTYQSPILIQWRRPNPRVRRLIFRLIRFS